MLKMRSSQDALLDADSLCLPTHQLFDFAQQPFEHQQHFHPPSPEPSPRAHQQRLSLSIKPPVLPPPQTTQPMQSYGIPAAKRSVSPSGTSVCSLPSVKKPRERVTTKDFVPPDVSGLSKREARLVKNRAAAFLSRQRKREEFEFMEVYVCPFSLAPYSRNTGLTCIVILPPSRVAELEKENARLLAIAQNNPGTSTVSHPSAGSPESEIDQLRAQLAAAQRRERELAAEVERNHGEHVKVESSDPGLSTPPSRAASLQPQKSGVGLGLMVRYPLFVNHLHFGILNSCQAGFALCSPKPSLDAGTYHAYII
jgi:hypothetical protein